MMRTPSSLTLLSFITSILKTHKNFLIFMACIGFLWALINTLIPYALKLVIDHVVAMTDRKAEVFRSTIPYVSLYVGLWLAMMINLRLNDWARLRLFPALREDIMTAMFRYTNQHSHRYFQNNFAGSLVNKIVDMQGGIVDILSTVDELYSQTFGLSIAMLILLSVHPVFSGILLLWALLFLVVTFIYLKPIAHLSHLFAESKSTLVGRMVDSLNNMMNIRLFARYREENAYIHESIKEAVNYDRAMLKKILHMRIFWDVSILLLLGGNVMMLLYMYSKDAVTIGDFTLVITLSISMLWNMWFLASQFVSFSEHIGRCKQALSALSVPYDIVDDRQAKPLVVSHGAIQFHEVTFSYHPHKPLFHEISLSIPGGQKVGLVGFSGSGKSTFVNLILRLYNVDSGHITVDDQDIQKVTQQSLRENIAFIPQDITLFHRSLRENLMFGHPQAAESDMLDVSKKAHCHEFISELPEGYDALVGERGIKLSGGQRQRIAIARAMLKNAPILICDEATSSLDSMTEDYIQQSLAMLMQGRTTIVIAHRLSTLAKMDRILVFDNGHIIEDGTHLSLLAQHGHYAKMWEMQSGGFLPESE